MVNRGSMPGDAHPAQSSSTTGGPTLVGGVGAGRESRTPELDGIRAVAILLVVVWHYVHLPSAAVAGTIWAKVNMLLRLTWSGVDLFFVLSGYLIGGILLDRRESPDYYRTFYLRRICRIFPLYFAFLGVCVLMGDARVRAAMPSVGWVFDPTFSMGYFATFTQNLAMASAHHFANTALNVTWSLAIEEQFYLLLPLMVAVVPVRRLPWVLLGLMGSGVVLRVAMAASSAVAPQHSAYVLLPCRWDPLFLGVLVAWAMRQPEWNVRLRGPGCWWLRPLFLLLAAGMVLAAITAKGVIMSTAMTVWGYSFLGLFYATGVMLVVVGRAPLAAACLRHPFLVRLGGISYGVYLLHETVNGAMHGLLLHARPRFVTGTEMLVTGLSFAVVLVLSEILWRVFERRFVDWGHRRFKYT